MLGHILEGRDGSVVIGTVAIRIMIFKTGGLIKVGGGRGKALVSNIPGEGVGKINQVNRLSGPTET